MKLRIVGVMCAAVMLAVPALLPAHAGILPLSPPADPSPSDPVVGTSTWFEALGSPYGGCGLPQSELDSPHFVALNVYDTPRDYDFYPRPVTDPDKVGMWNNGLNCGRWVEVEIDDICTGINDGAPGQDFCRGGEWVSDQFNGASLTMLIADSCGDSNAWCRDDPFHLDLAKASLSQFEKDGAPVGDLLPDHYNNRRVKWSFVPAPDYTGDIRIGFLQGAQRWWPAIAVSRLPNGIHGVQHFTNGAWVEAEMNSDMGQSYIIDGVESGSTDFRIRVRDVDDQLINDAREYSFSLPPACDPQCSQAYVEVSYTTDEGGPTPTPTVTATPTVTPPSTPTPPTTPTVGTCSAEFVTAQSWPGGYQAEVLVHNLSTSASTSWTVDFTFPGSQTVANSWNAVVSQSGQAVTATNQHYNGSIPAGGSMSFGMIVDGADQPPANISCSLR